MPSGNWLNIKFSFQHARICLDFSPGHTLGEEEKQNERGGGPRKSLTTIVSGGIGIGYI